jgi:hypothetical protein
MLRLKLKGFMRQRGLTEVALADAIAEAFIETGEDVSERHLRYVVKNTELIARKKGQHNPSLVMLGYIIEGLRHLTGEKVEVSDVLEFVSLVPPLEQPPIEPPQDNVTHVEQRESLELVVLEQLETDDILDEMSELVVQSLKDKGFSNLGSEFERITREDESHETTVPRRKRDRTSKGVIMMLAGLLFMGVAFILYDQFVLKPQLIAGYTRLFTTRDRVRPTSSLPVPTLIGPEGEISQLTPTLRVAPVEKAVGYEFYVENTVSEDYVYTGPVVNPSFLIPAGTLCPNTTYTWRARALGNDGWTSISSPLTFTVTSDALEPSQRYLLNLANIKSRPPTPGIVAPVGTTNTTTPTLEVTKFPNIYSYGFYIRDLGSDKLVYENHFVSENSVTLPEGVLENGGVYQWNARSRNCHYWSEFTPTQIFTVNVNE